MSETRQNLEADIWRIVQESIGNAIAERVKQGYGDAPLNKLIDAVVASRSEELRKLLNDAFDGALKGDFRAALQAALSHKLARVIVSKCESEIEKKAGELRASPEFRARVTLAIEREIKELKTP